MSSLQIFFTIQLIESTQNNQNCQTLSLSKYPILQTGQQHNHASQRSEIQISENKKAHVHPIIPKASQAKVYRGTNACETVLRRKGPKHLFSMHKTG